MKLTNFKLPGLAVGILVVLVGVGFLFKYPVINQPVPTPTFNSAEADSRDYVPTADDTVNALLKRAKLAFPDTEIKNINQFDLPADIKQLIDAENTVIVSRLDYTDGRTGYLIKYASGIAMNDAYRFIMGKTETWTTLFAARGFGAALIEKQTPSFSLRAILKVFDPSTTEITLQTITR